MTKPMIRIHDIETDKIVDREMNASELKQYEADLAAHAAKIVETEAAITIKDELLNRLGITAEEAKLLLS
jgi:hypothetical protein